MKEQQASSFEDGSLLVLRFNQATAATIQVMDEACCSLKEDVPEPPKSEPSVRKAASPFDEGDADITLRTSDNVEFRVHRVILSQASSVFKDMFSMPQPSTGDNDPIPVTEDDKTLDTFLRICYPILNPKPTSLVQIRKVLSAAVKYDAPLVVQQMRDVLMEPEFVDLQPLTVFTIGCIFDMEEVAQAAAETSVISGLGWSSSAIYDYPKLDDISAGAYCRLLQLRRTRTTVTEPPKKRKKNRKGPSYTTPTPALHYTINFQGIIPLCRSPLPWQTLPPAKSRFKSVSEPFTDMSGDLVLRTSDGFNFYAYRNILALASPTFLDALIAVGMDDRPGGSGPTVPIHQVQESAVILDILLRICYPVPHPRPTDPDVFLAVLFATQRYGMSKAEQILRGEWLGLSETSPMRFYFVAVELGWRKEAMACADRLASLSISSVQTYIPEMESIGSAPYRNLLVYVSSKKSSTGSTAKLEWVEGACGTLVMNLDNDKIED